MTNVRTTRRWRGVVAVALVAGATGVLLSQPALLLLATVGIGYAAYPQLPSAPTVELDLERSVDDAEHGEPVDVTVTVRNVGSSTLYDLRIIDGVPPMLLVTDGTPRHATVLRPGGEATFSYEVTAKHGTHWFEPATVIARDLSGGTEVETQVETETAIECATPVPEMPLRRQTDQYVGTIVTDEGGSGIEFHGTREYRHGDAMNRIDWKRFARTGELTTVEYREERLASIVLLVDAREAAYRAAADDDPHGVSYGLAAVEQMLAALVETPNRVGLAAIGRDTCYLPPGSGVEHGTRARQLLGSHRTLSAYAPDPEATTDEVCRSQVAELRARISSHAQVVFVTPLPDEFAAQTALTLEAAGHAVSVVSPDVSTDGTVGSRLAGVERRHRVSALREADIPVVDWDTERPLGTALAGAERGWTA